MDKELKSEDLAKVAGGTLPELPATTLEESAYSNMFAPCEPIVPTNGLPAISVLQLEQPEPGLPGFQPDKPEATIPDRYKVNLTFTFEP